MAGHGGARPGAGRKSKAERFESQINAAEQQIADRLPAILDDLLELAHGGYERVEEKYLPAGLITTGSGEREALAFPHLDPEALVCVERKRSIADHDRASLIYLFDRILGRPTQRAEITGEDGGPIEVTDARERLTRRIAELAARGRTGSTAGDAE